MKTSGFRCETKFGLLVFLGHPNGQVRLTPHQEGLHYLEDISAGKLLVLEHGRREGVDGGPDVVVEKEDVKTSVGEEYLKRNYQFAYFRCTACQRALRTQDSMLQCRYTSKTA